MTQSNQTKSPFQIDPCDNTITLVRGNTCPLNITPIQEIDGVKSPYILQEGDKVIFTIQTRLAGTDVFKKILTNADCDENLNLTFKLNYEDTVNLELTTYEYDIALQTASGDFYTFIPLSYFKIVKNVSQLIEDTSNEDGTTELGIISPALELTGIIEKAESVIEKDYDKLINKPSINDIELVGNKTFEELGITDLVQNKLETSNIIAGTNITLGVSGNDVTINSTGGGGGTGIDGKSAYEIAVENGFIGTEAEWLESLKGDKGDKGEDGINGADGKSAYEVWLSEGNIGTELDFLNSLKGENGIDGIDGDNGTSITSALVNNDGDLIVTLDTGVSSNAGHVKGADGTSINIKGDLLSPDDLPSSSQELGDCYIISGHLWVYVDSTDVGAVNGFKDVGNIQGVDGKSAYEVAISNGFIGTEPEWLLSLKGDKGEQGEQGADGKDGTNGINGLDGIDGVDGTNGKSAYEIALEDGFAGTESEWLASLKGADGAKGDKGDKGDTGANGADGIDGTDGVDGADGKSAYQVWLDNGNTGTELEFLASLKGEQGLQGLKGDKGDKGEDGADGYTPVKGTDYFTSADIESLDIANKVDKVEGKSLISDTEIERLSTVTNYDDSSKFNDDILKPTSLPFIGGNSLGWAYGTTGVSLASTTIKHPNITENHPTLEYSRIGLLEDSKEDIFRRGYGVTGYIGNTYTFSVSLYTEDNTSIDSSGILIQLKGARNTTGNYTEDVIVKNITSENLPNNRWTTFSITLKIAEEVPYVDAIISVVRNAKFFIAQYQVQEGEIATGFYPAPPRLATYITSGLMSPSQYTELNKILYNIMKYSFIATNGNKLDPDTANSTVDFVAGENINLTVGYNDDLEADTITIDADISSKADKSYVDSLIGEGGKSAYEVAVENGFTGTEAEWIASLKGEDGDNGSDGKSAYEIAVQNGFIGTEEEWLESLKGSTEVPNIVSVTELPENPEPNTWYAIREVTT